MFQSLESKGGGINDGIGNQNEKKKKEGYLLVLRKPVGNEWAITWRSMVGFISGRASDTAPRLVWSLSFSNIFSNSWSNVCNQCCECHVVCWKFPGIIPFLRGRFHKWGNSREMASLRETVKALTRSVLFDTSWRHRPKLVKQLLASRFDPNQVLGEIEFLVNRLRYKHKVITPLNGLNLVRKSWHHVASMGYYWDI